MPLHSSSFLPTPWPFHLTVLAFLPTPWPFLLTVLAFLPTPWPFHLTVLALSFWTTLWACDHILPMTCGCGHFVVVMRRGRGKSWYSESLSLSPPSSDPWVSVSSSSSRSWLTRLDGEQLTFESVRCFQLNNKNCHYVGALGNYKEKIMTVPTQY